MFCNAYFSFVADWSERLADRSMRGWMYLGVCIIATWFVLWRSWDIRIPKRYSAVSRETWIK